MQASCIANSLVSDKWELNLYTINTQPWILHPDFIVLLFSTALFFYHNLLPFNISLPNLPPHLLSNNPVLLHYNKIAQRLVGERNSLKNI